MENLTEEQESYINRYEAWKAVQLLLMDGIKLTIINSESMIHNHRKTLEVSHNSLTWEEEFYARAVKLHEQWLIDNNIK